MTHGHIDTLASNGTPQAVFRSDRGSRYASAEYAQVSARPGVVLSVGRTGSCHDDAVAESWCSMLRNEMYYRNTFTTGARARFAVVDYVEVFHNRRRRHPTLGHRTPAAVHVAHQNPQPATAA
ncbi:integrase core domain-containing protein [Aeromicrobium sp.]|uniref:integrase core domain-containing protein n=1 Tax=Aeromicrobium sp. TaxID=1871063 RepID=UPI0039E3068E